MIAVGDIPYMSEVTKREEPLPIAISLIGAPGKTSVSDHNSVS